MLSEQMQRAIAQACVTIVKPDGARGRGVLVPGQMVLTAAHCVTYTNDATMALGEHFSEMLQTAQGELQVAPLAVEPVTDIAVLGALDYEEFPQEVEAFETWCASTPAVPVCFQDVLLFEPFPVYIYTHIEQWVEARATVTRADLPRLWVEVSAPLESGTSGSPIVTPDGAVIGIVSNTGSRDDVMVCYGIHPRASLALPAWVLQQIQAEQDDEHGREA
jgi:hypothetical protein